MKLAKADATLEENKPLAERFGVKGYPTLKIIRNHDASSPSDYNGPREADGIVNYLAKQAGPASVAIKEASQLAAMTAKEDVVVVGLFPGGTPSDAFLAVANAMRDQFAFAHAGDGSLLPGGSSSDPVPSVVLLKTFDEPRTVTQDSLGDSEALRQWVATHSLPLVARLDQVPKNQAAMRRVFEFPAPKVLAFADFASSPETEANVNAALLAAAKAHPALRFVLGDSNGNDHALKFFGISADSLPAAVIHDTRAGEKKYVRTNMDFGELQDLVASFQAGSLQATVKSEPVPEPNDGPVTTLVAHNFNAVVNAPGKTVLLEFYAPWCGHCKQLAPKYEEVGKHFAGREDVVIAAMDATANDVVDSRFNVKGFPTLYLKTAAGEVVPYSGDRSESDLIHFVESHAKGGDADAVAPEPAPEPAKDEL